ncbi:hypothetical protein ACFFIX_22065 [Metabacillus herbersteinensis]|uniref:Uncharacterized protein n=1 Tax=Metabacillus herbersteinensis TaxID=283816 RepID=A0ABV6GK25_9BACI
MLIENLKLGIRYENLGAATVDKSPSELVITDNNGETYYIVTREVYQDGPQQRGYKVIVNEGE